MNSGGSGSSSNVTMETKISESSDMVSKDTGRERQEWQSSSFLVSTEILKFLAWFF